MQRGRIQVSAILLMLGLAFSGAAFSRAYDCLMEPMQTVEISSPVAGVLETVLVKRGDPVKKGQVIATLDSRTERAAMEAAKLRSEAMGPTQTARKKIEFSQQKYERRKLMANDQLMTGQERDDAEAELRIAQAELQTAQENRAIAAREYAQQASLVAQRTLRSPFDGVVLDRLLSPGELTESSGTKKGILKLAQIHPIRVHLVLPEQLFGRLKIGDAVNVQPQYAGARLLAAKVSQIDRLIDAASGTFAVFMTIPNPDLSIPAGMRCKVEL